MLNRTAVPLLGVLILLSSPALASTWYVSGVNGIHPGSRSQRPAQLSVAQAPHPNRSP
jgi:hypothetical protein